MTAGEKLEPRLPVQQLAILAICRFAEPIALTSVNPYLPSMIESFGVPEDDVAKWVGITSASFSLTQCVTSFSWQNLADRIGRKYAVMIALSCAMMSTLFFGFSQSLPWAIAARCFSGGSNGTVGIVRTMVAELVTHRSLQPRAFSVMPLVWNVGSVFGPILGGAFAMPATNFPRTFGKNEFFKRYPYALPNIVSACVFSFGILFGILFVRETLESKKHTKDYGLELGKYITSPFTKRKKASWMDDVQNDDKKAGLRAPPRRASLREVFTFQSTMNLVAYTILSLHAIAYDQLLAVFLHMHQQDHSLANQKVKLPFRFAGGFGLKSGEIGVLFTIFGISTMLVQFLLFPPLANRYGVLTCLRACFLLFPFVYFITPFTVLMPTPSSRQAAVLCVGLMKGFAGVFAYPCSTVLITNSARSIPVLGTLNAVTTSVSALAKALGPAVAGQIFTRSIEAGYIVTVWWILAIIAIPGFISTFWIVEMEGPSGDSTSGSGTVGASQDEDGIEEEELALLTAVDAADQIKNTPSGSPPKSPNGYIISAGDEEQAVSLLDIGDSSSAAALGAHVDGATTGLELSKDVPAELQVHSRAGHVDRAVSPTPSLRPPLTRENSAASTARSASVDPGFHARAAFGRLRSPTPMQGMRLEEDEEEASDRDTRWTRGRKTE